MASYWRPRHATLRGVLMRTKGTPVELVSSPLACLVHQLGASPNPLSTGAGAPRRSHPAGSHAAFLVTAVATTLALGLTAYGVVSDRNGVAMIGLTATVLVGAALVVGTSSSMHRREALLAANDELQRRNADLEALHLAVGKGLDVIDEQTQGRLLELIEEAGDELAALVDETLDDAEGA